ncbi:36.4 kDa proline-rich protein-like [Solanum verrucosum]|uniref:36.4 kDa proline-rich protein-like n=1 Tax=Solanum verrucosum TaxID=315347 RepID=UPI0020D1BA6C|nr:36.4 kDa proline-rich protein-like [Solanum verrucosum]
MCVVFLTILLSIITTSPLAHAQLGLGGIVNPILGRPIVPPVGGQVPPIGVGQLPIGIGPLLGPITGPILGPIAGPILGPILGQPIRPPVGQVPPIVPPVAQVPPVGQVPPIVGQVPPIVGQLEPLLNQLLPPIVERLLQDIVGRLLPSILNEVLPGIVSQLIPPIVGQVPSIVPPVSQVPSIVPPVGQVPPIVPPVVGQPANITIRGVVSCSTSGNAPGPGIGGVNVAIICGNTTLAQVITNVEGLINVTLSTNTNILFGNTSTLSCVARVALPIVNCTLLPTSGILQAPLMLVGNIIQGVGGVVLSALVGTFSLVTLTI